MILISLHIRIYRIQPKKYTTEENECTNINNVLEKKINYTTTFCVYAALFYVLHKIFVLNAACMPQSSQKVLKIINT